MVERFRPSTAMSGLGILGIAALFLVLSNIYGLVTPVFEASDELFHYPYVRLLAVERRLPGQDPQNIGLWRQEGSQPPLYYLIAAAATWWVDTSDFGERLVHNPHAQTGIPLAPTNKNMVIHTPAERFPYRGTVLAVHLIRFLSTLMGTGTALLAYRIAREVLPKSRHTALMAAALVAFNPMFLFISASVNNDNLAVLLCSLALYQLVRLPKSGASPRNVVGLGLVTGLAALTKLSALGLTLLAALVISWDAWRRRSWRAWLRYGLVCAGLVTAVAGWWYARNWALYGDPLGLKVWLAISGSRSEALAASDLLAEFEGFRISYWGLFGGVNVLMHPLVYRFYDTLCLLALAGLVVAGGRWLGLRVRNGKRAATRPGAIPRSVQLLVVGLWPLVLLLSLVRWTLLTPASQGRLIFPGIAAVSFWLALGWTSLFSGRWQARALRAVGVALLVPAALAPWLFIAPAYAAPPVADVLPEGLNPLHITYGDQLELVGYQLPQRGVRPGQMLAVDLGWRSLAPMEEDYSIFVHLYGRGNEFLGQADTYPGGGLAPTSQWLPGDQRLDRVYLPVKGDAQAPGVGRIVVGVYRFADMTMLAAADPNGAILGTSPTIGRFKVAAFTPAEVEVPEPVDYDLGPKLALVGYDLSGAPAEIALYWKAREPVATDYTVFVHLLDGSGQMVAGADSQPQAGEYPTSLWDTEEIVVDRHKLVPETVQNLPAGEYAFSVGLYDLGTMVRLPVSRAGRLLGDQVLIGPLTIP